MSSAMTVEETTSHFETPLGAEEVYLRLLDELQPAPVEFNIGAGRIFYGIQQHLPDFDGMNAEKAILTNAIADAVYPLAAYLYAQAVSLKLFMLNGTSAVDWSQHKAFASCTIFDLDRHSRIHYALTPDDPDITKKISAHHGLAVICEPLSYNYHRMKDDRRRFAKVKQNIWEWTERKVSEWYEQKKPLATINPDLQTRTPTQSLKESLTPVIEAVVAAIITALPAALVTDSLKEKIALAVKKPMQPTTAPVAPQQVPLPPAVPSQATPVSLTIAQAPAAQQVRTVPQAVPQPQTTPAIPMAVAAAAMPAATKPASTISAQPVLPEQTPPLAKASFAAQPISLAAHPAAPTSQPAAESALVKQGFASTHTAAQAPVAPMPVADAVDIKPAAPPVAPAQRFSVAQGFHSTENITEQQRPAESRPVSAQPEPAASNQQPQQQPRQERATEQTVEQQPEAKPAQADNKEASANQPEPQKEPQAKARKTTEPEPAQPSRPTQRPAQPTEQRAAPTQPQAASAEAQQRGTPEAPETTPTASPRTINTAPEPTPAEQTPTLKTTANPVPAVDAVAPPAEQPRHSVTPQPSHLHSEQEYDLLRVQPQHHVYAGLSPEHVQRAQPIAQTLTPQPEATTKPAPQPKLKTWFMPRPKANFPTPTPTPTGFGGVFGWWKK